MSRPELDPQRWRSEIADVGYSVAPGVFTPDETATLRSALDDILRREHQVATARGWANDVYRVSYMVAAKSPVLLGVAGHPALLRLVRAVLGDDCVLAALNGLTPTPRGRGQRFHQDQAEPSLPSAVTLNAVCALDPFAADNGAIRILPGSQRWTTAAANDADLEDRAVTVLAEPGSVIGYDGAVWHASGKNQTSSSRLALHAFYARPWLVPHWDFPASLPSEVQASLTDEQRRLLGFETRPRRYDTVRDQWSR